MKVSEAVGKDKVLRGTRSRVLAYLEARPDEVFRPSECGEIAEALDVPKKTVAYALWTLYRDGHVQKARLLRGIWYGCQAAVEALLAEAKREGLLDGR